MKTSPTWQQHAAATFGQEFHVHDSSSLYAFFGELLERVRQAHAANDTPMLRRAYGFASWCIQNPEEGVWNPAGVSFYEHLVDHPITLAAIPEWVSPDVFRSVQGLFEFRLRADKKKYQELLVKYDKKRKTNFSRSE